MSAARSQFRGTDGPWTMVHAGGDEWQIHGKEDGEYIDGRAVDRTPVVVEFVGNKADARLIATAPELLEALVDAAGLINRMWAWERTATAEEVKPTLELINTINAAIAKALKP